jgi:hypothetical protein
VQWFISAIPPTEIRRMTVQGQLRQKVSETPNKTCCVWGLAFFTSAIQEARGGRIIV